MTSPVSAPGARPLAYAARRRGFNPLGRLGAALLGGLLAAAGSPAASQDADEIVVVALGDSLTHGFGLPIEDGFTAQLEAWLRDQGAGPVRVQNAGVSGDTTSGGRARLDWSVGPDADAVIVELGANDALRGVDPAIARENLDQILARLGERGLPVLFAGMYAPRNWGAQYVAEFEAIYPDLAAKHDVPLYPFFLDGVAADPALNQPDGIHPNAAGVAVIVARIGPMVVELVETARAGGQADASTN